MEREKALDMALGQIERQFGKGAIMRMDEQAKVKIPVIPTGALSLDLALGIGGLPRGRVVEIYGPESSGKTTVALHAIAEAQKAGGIAAFVDAEHALDPTYAAALGVDIEALLVSQPDTGEQALEIADMLIRSGAIDMLVIDSVAALTPRAEIEGEMGDSHVGLQARLMSQALRKLAGTLNRSRTCAVFVNQIREKVGVMFGCMSFATKVTLADGSQEEIGRIVDRRLPVEVLSYDPELGRVVPKRVTNWFDNGPTDGFLTFAVARGADEGPARFSCTPDHEIRTPAGWRRARELRVGDRVLRSVPHHLSGLQWEVVLGGVLGGGALSPTESGHGASLGWRHERRRAGYADWKASLFANIGTARATDARGAVAHAVDPLAELAEVYRAVYLAGRKVLSHDYLKQLTPLSLAIWYMDRASLVPGSAGGERARADVGVEGIEPTSRSRLVEYLRDEWGITCRPTVRAGRAVLAFGPDGTEMLHALIAPYVHPSMEHELLPRYRGRFSVEPSFAPARFELVPMPILSRATEPAPEGDLPHRYDIEVAGTHNYFVDGVMVHNSPETQPGGRALKFYSSVRLDVRRIESLKDGTDFVGNRVRVKVVKNKCVAAGTKIFDPTSGTTHAVERIVDRGEGTAVWAVDKRGEFHVREIRDRFDQGEQDVIDLRLRDGAAVSVTPDHLVLTEQGWRQAGELGPGDRVARPRRAGGFGEREPVSVPQSRMVGYLIGHGDAGGGTPIAFVSAEPSLREDAAHIAAELGCATKVRPDGLEATFSPRPGERDGLLALARWAGISGGRAPEKRIPAEFFAPDVAEEVVANLLFGIWEADGWISREPAGGLRCGFATTSEQRAWQVHWLLLRWGITSVVRVEEPEDRRSLAAGRPVEAGLPCWQVRVGGIDSVERLAQALPMWGPKGRALTAALGDPALAEHRDASGVELSAAHREPVLAYLESRGVTATAAAGIVGVPAGHARAGLGAVLGSPRIRRDRLERLAAALDSAFLREVLADELSFERIDAVSEPYPARTFDVEVSELHNLVADDVVVHNCAPPFKQAEFDILFGEGISREGSILDVGVDQGIVKKAGAWYTYDGEQLGQGRENARQFLKEHDDVTSEIYKKVTERLGLVPTDVTGDEVSPPEDG